MLTLGLFSNRRLRVTVAVALLSALGNACAGEDDPSAGVLVVPFELGNRRDCDAVGVRVVRAELDDPLFVEEALCETGSVRFQKVPPGNYRVRLFGLDTEGVAIMDSLKLGEVPVAVIGDGTTVIADPAITLTAAPAHLLVRWGFGFGTCESMGIDHFAIKAWRSDGSALLLDTTMRCELAGQGPEQYRLIPDKDRALSGEEVGEVDIQPLDKSGIPVGKPLSFSFDVPGAGRQVKLSLHCENGGCEGSGSPD